MEHVIRWKVTGATSIDGMKGVCLELVRAHEPDQSRAFLIQEPLARELCEAISKCLKDSAKLPKPNKH